MSYLRSKDPSSRRGARSALAAVLSGALALGGVALTPLAASADVPTGTISDATFEWGLSNEAGSGAYFGGCNFLSAGVAGDTGSSRLWSPADGFWSQSAGNVSIWKNGPDSEKIATTWLNKCQTATGTAVSAGSTASNTGNIVRITHGEGTVSSDGSAEISWDGDFSVVFYGGLTYWTASDPVLTVDADGSGQITATASGYGTSMEDMSEWVAIAPRTIVLAELPDVDVTETGFTTAPAYAGVETTSAVGSAQVRTGGNWGSFPQSFIDFQDLTGQHSYWYSSGGARDAAKPATPVTVDYTIDVPAPEVTTSPLSQSVTTGDAVSLSVVATNASSYQWEAAASGSDSWSAISGATAATYAFAASTATSRQYRVVVTGDGGSVASAPATVTVDVPVPTVTVSQTSGLVAEGELVTVTGSGFLPNAPLTTGTRPPLAGQFTGAYIALASRGEDGSLSNYTNSLSAYTTWAVREANLAAIGGSGAIIAQDGTFSVEILAEDFALAEGRTWGIRTYAAGGSTYSAFATFTPITFADPDIESALPTISGSATVGSTLTALPGEWTPGAEFSYQWLRDGVAIDGATSAEYTLVAADNGANVSVRVTGSLAGYASLDEFSVAEKVAAGALTGATPTVTGTAKVGVELTGKAGAWTPGTALAYQWLRGGAAIQGATASTYTPVAADKGQDLTLRVTGTQAGYTTLVQTSSPVKVAAGALAGKVPTVTGTAKVGVKLTAKPGTWTSGTSFSYQWLRNGVAIKGATASTYTPVAADRGKKVSVKVTGAKSGYASIAKSSTAKTVASGTLKAATPKISGTAKVGKKLTAVKGTWTAGTSVTYQWYVGGKAVKGATKSTYTLKSADRAKTVKVKTKGAKSGYSSVVKTSAGKTVR